MPKPPKDDPRTALPRRPDKQTAKIYTSEAVPLAFAAPGHRYGTAELKIHGIFHSEASYEGRVFLNNPKATADTPRTQEQGYAGSFHIFGHGGCLGDPGHCEVSGRRREKYDYRRPHPLTPATKRIKVTEVLRQIAATAKAVTVTIVPVVQVTSDLCDQNDVFRFESMEFLTYN